MIVTPNTKSITEYTLTLSEADASLAMNDPYSFGDNLAEQLRTAGVTPAPSGLVTIARAKLARKKTVRRPKVVRVARSTRKNGHSPRPAPTAGTPVRNLVPASLEPLQCPHCPKKIARKYLANHIRKLHGVPPASHGTSQAPAPAAA